MEVQLQAAELRRPEAALRAVQKPPAKPWRGGAGLGGSSASQPPPKVYRVEPREFRDLVQRLTGAPPTARRHHMPAAAAPPVQPVPVRAAASEHQHQQQQLYGSWFSFPLAGVDGGSGGGGGGGLM